jgi:hypothetical protein
MRHRPAVRPRREHLARLDAPVDPGHLADAADEAAEPPALGVLVVLLLEDDEVDRPRDQHVRRLDRQPLRGLDRVRRDPVEYLERGVRVDRRQGAVVALGHRVEHGDDLVAENLADDHAARVHAQRAADELGHRDGALPLAVGQAFLERDGVGVQFGEVVEAKLKRPFDGDEPFLGRDLVGQRAQQRRLARVGGARDHDVFPGQHGGREEAGQLGAHRLVADEIGEEHLAHPRAADGDRGAQRDVHDRRQPRAVRQAQVKLGVGGVEGAARQAGVGGQRLDELDEFLVALRHRLGHHLAAVGVADKDPVAAVDVDVLDLLVFEQRLEPAHAEERGVHRLGQVLFLLCGERRAAGRDLRARVVFHRLRDQGPGELPLILAGHGLYAGGRVHSALLGESVAHVTAESLDQTMIHGKPSPPQEAIGLQARGIVGVRPVLGRLGCRRSGGVSRMERRHRAGRRCWRCRCGARLRTVG